MSFVTLRDILAEAQEDGWAVPAFDVINHETVLAVLDGAAAERAPVILMILPSHTPQRQWPGLVNLIQTEARQVDVPVCLLLDHATRLDQVRAALELGFSAVMIDGSTLPLAENIAISRQVVVEAHARGASVEAELGHVGGGNETLTQEHAASHLTPVEEAERFVAETGVDALAVAIGTVHGLYRFEPRLDFDRLRRLRQAVSVPLVLHGGSGTPDDEIRKAIANGICKVNIWTEVALAFASTLREQLRDPPHQFRLHEALTTAKDTAQEVVRSKIRLLGAANRV